MVDLSRIASGIGFLVFVAVVVAFVAVAFPAVVGADQSYVVTSSSMSPSIGAGSVVFVSDVPAAAVVEGDVITFEPGGQSSPERVTHRVVDVLDGGGDRRFRTKGDANENVDPETVGADQLVGHVKFHVPLIGYAVRFAGSQYGIMALVIVPAILLVVTELRDFARAWNSEVESDGSTNESQ
jgi:signal peptidase